MAEYEHETIERGHADAHALADELFALFHAKDVEEPVALIAICIVAASVISGGDHAERGRDAFHNIFNWIFDDMRPIAELHKAKPEGSA